MFYTLTLENETGQQIDLSRTANRFMFSKIEGLNPPAGTVSTSSYAGMDGSYLNNAFIESETWSFLLKCVPVTYADSKALEDDYGFRPTISIREGLRKFAQWYAEYYK